MTELTIVLNFIIIFLLVTAIVYGVVLNKRISLIRNSARELTNLFRSFDDTILNAQNSVEDLKRVSSAVEHGLQKKIDKAAMLIDDIEFLNEKSTKAADSLSAAIVNFKKIENLVPVGIQSQGRSVMNMPSPPLPTKSSIPAKPLITKGKKSLEGLLEEAGIGEKNRVKIAASVNNNEKRPDAENSGAEKRQFSIASALKALGYGE